MNLRAIAGTGHRPATRNNPGGITAAQLPWVREKCRAGLLWLRAEHGTVEVWSGMALGWDVILAAAAVGLGFPLRAKVPYLSQPDRWPDEADRIEWRRLVGLAVSVDVTGPDPSSKQEAAALLHRRNDELLKANGLFALWDERKRTGGTYSAVTKAARAGMPVVHLNLGAQVVCGLDCSCVTALVEPTLF